VNSHLGSPTVDLNSSTERELATLPSIGIILAKRAVSLRESQGGFGSVEDFGTALKLRPEAVERIRPLVSVSPARQPRSPGQSGRLVDY
jgi:DNA uptake protein ComE-like DNA-binding protein